MADEKNMSRIAPTPPQGQPRSSDPSGGGIPPLRDGDRLTREEFHRRYEAMPELNNAELIEGIVYLPSPVFEEWHGEPDMSVSAWLGMYSWRTPGVIGASNCTVIMDDLNEPQPDSYLRIGSRAMSQTWRDAEGYLHGAPELVAETSASRKSYDLGPKRTAYLRNGVREYIVYCTKDRALLWFILRAGQYERLEPDARGVIRSEAFPGLWLDVTGMLRNDGPAILHALEEGLATPEHDAFVAKLSQVAPTGGPST